MKKTLSLLLALVLVLGSFSTVFAAMPETDVEKAELLKELGILVGDNSGDLMLDEDLNRAQAVVILSRLMKAGDVAKEFPVDDLPFDDVTDPIYPHYVAWAVANDLTQGISATKFDPKGDLTAQQFATFLLRALGYEIDAEAYETAFETAEELGIFADLNVEKETVLKRKDMAVMTFNVLYVPMKDSEVTLGEFLELELPQEEPEVPATLEAEVVADNLKSFMVVFNQPVKSAKVTVKDVELEDDTSLSEDKTTFVGAYKTKLDQSSTVTFVINAETEAGLKLEDYEVKKTVNDVTIPVLLSAKALNPKQIELLFSEPVQLDYELQLIENIKVDGESIVAKTKVDPLTNKVTVTLYDPMSEGTKVLKVSNVKDYADLAIVDAEFNITVVKDEDAPVAVSAEVLNNKEIVVTFNEPLDEYELGTFTVDGVEVEKENIKQIAPNKIKLVLEKELTIAAVIEVRIGYKGQKDVMGNEVKETKYITTKVEDDITLPTVELTSVEVKDGFNVITLTFNKAMTTDAGKYQILDKNDNVIAEEEFKDAENASFESDKKVLKIKALDDKNPDKYSVKLIDMKDASIRTNPLGTVTLSFTAKDTKAPKVDPVAKLEIAEKPKNNKYTNKITIYFSEAMDKDTIENLANYMVGGKPLHSESAYTEAKAAADKKSVVITYVTPDEIDEDNVNITIKVLKTVKDEAGNTLDDDADVEVSPVSKLSLEVVGNAKLTAANKIEVKFNNSIQTVYTSLFKVMVGKDSDAEELKGNSIRSYEIDGETVIFTLAKDLDLDEEYSLKVVDNKLVKDKFGNFLAEDEKGVLVDDEVVPTLTVAKYAKDEIKFTFSRNVKFKVSDFKNNLYVDGDKADEVVVAVYTDGKKDTLVDGDVEVTGKVFIVKLNVADVTKVKVGFPTNDNAKVVSAEKDDDLKLKATGYLEVK